MPSNISNEAPSEMNSPTATSAKPDMLISILARMTMEEKIGQMSQYFGHGEPISEHLVQSIRQGRVGSVINEVRLHTVNELQRLAVEESRLGIPLLIGRDVIHGFNTIFPIPLGQAASWCAETVKQCAHISALEAATAGVNWTFAPMIDISRDPRWGRIAESLGEDPYLCSVLGVAMLQGFQGDELRKNGSIAACAKHFAGYGAGESGRDYSTTNIPENELRNVYLPPFKAAADAGVATFMSAFSDLNGVPASGNKWLMTEILREEWDYKGFVVSDWESIQQLTTHGFSKDNKNAAYEASNSGIDMEMVSSTYLDHLPELIAEGRIDIQQIDSAVNKILQLKWQLGLFDSPYTDASLLPTPLNSQHLQIAKDAAIKSCVLLKNDKNILPLSTESLHCVAIIGPLADDPYEQLGTWIFDGDSQHSQTCLTAIEQELSGKANINYVKTMETSRSYDQTNFKQAVESAAAADVALLILGEESILSGEAHCRAEIGLPGCQEQLIDRIAATGTPIVLVIMAGRPLTIETVLPKVAAVLFAWHPGTMGGPAISDLLFGKAFPSGKLPVTFPRKIGQVPIYYAQKHSGKPATEAAFVHMDDIPVHSPQTSLGMAATHLDTHFSPLFPFGFGLAYTQFSYRNLELSHTTLHIGETLTVRVLLTNTGDTDGEEIAQLYIRDLVGSVTRPVKELKDFKRIKLAAGTSKWVTFELSTDKLAFYDRNMQLKTETGQFHLWLGGCSQSGMQGEFEITDD
ncbi:beta-glucosidase BglX [Paraglaciecola sp. MB-3u-78]|uniref:beta-glucosidase BglX n=1 Tax=Paraglaciecola sp. MB-3u-78 TaxID=2058332 RepID=UPI000C32BCD4|nr:beta-glucosidase BglX [Paraglaciecola sp. MB-3u-78]PKG99760.1 beta-glucosidase BglX [Paraglaciecola sp. MB-3u-78]